MHLMRIYEGYPHKDMSMIVHRRTMYKYHTVNFLFSQTGGVTSDRR
jgi:hypothetical protein